MENNIPYFLLYRASNKLAYCMIYAALRARKVLKCVNSQKKSQAHKWNLWKFPKISQLLGITVLRPREESLQKVAQSRIFLVSFLIPFIIPALLGYPPSSHSYAILVVILVVRYDDDPTTRSTCGCNWRWCRRSRASSRRQRAGSRPRKNKTMILRCCFRETQFMMNLRECHLWIQNGDGVNKVYPEGTGTNMC